MRPLSENDAQAPLQARFSFHARVSLYFGCIFSVFGVMQPYLAVWFVERGLSVGDVALIMTVAPFVRMVASPAVTFLADRLQAHWYVMIISGWLYLAAWLVMAGASGLWGLMAAQAMVSTAGAALIPLVDALALSGVKARGLDYGRMRVWGSLTFICASIGAGWVVDRTGLWIAIWLMAAGALASALAGHCLPRPTAAAQQRPVSLADAAALVRAPAFLLFLLVGGTFAGSHALLNIFSVVHWQSQGISSGWCGALWGIGVISEVVLFVYAGTWLRSWSPLALLATGGTAAVVRWAAMALDPPLGVLVPLQLLHGLSFGAAHLGAMLFLGRAIPDAQAGTGQGLYAVMTAGIAGALAAYISGVSYQAMAGQAYGVMALFAVAGLIALAALARTWAGGPVVSPAH